MGIFCSHPYPHTSDSAASSLPKALKGTDLAVFSVLQSLGLKVEVLPILETDGDYSTDPKLNVASPGPRGSSRRSNWEGYYEDYSAKQDLEKFQNTGKMTKKVFRDWDEWDEVETGFVLRYVRLFQDFDGVMDLETHWKTLLLAKYPRGLGRPAGSRVGHGLHPYCIRNAFRYEREVSSLNGISSQRIY